MAYELFSENNEPKYLNSDELDRFIKAAMQQDRHEVRTFCLVLAHTGCRVSEALALTVKNIDLTEHAIRFRTLKQRETVRFRVVPVPESTTDALNLVHDIRKEQRRRGKPAPLWMWHRSRAWSLIKGVMVQADIEGPQATAKGLRHGFAMRAMQRTRNPRLVQKWLGHRNIENTMIYMDAIGSEERAEAMRLWE
jgi:integrase/recombinase XerD